MPNELEKMLDGHSLSVLDLAADLEVTLEVMESYVKTPESMPPKYYGKLCRSLGVDRKSLKNILKSGPK